MEILLKTVSENTPTLISRWLEIQVNDPLLRSADTSAGELRRQAEELLDEMLQALESLDEDTQTTQWSGVRSFLATLTKRRTALGYSPRETAGLVLSLKLPLFRMLEEKAGKDEYEKALWSSTRILDSLALHVTDIYHRDREQLIGRQRDDLMELSAPVISLWDGVLCMPLIGTLDSTRSQDVMESLLTAIADKEADVAIIDITAVGAIDTQTAQYLIKTVKAARLMGSDCIISGVGPEIAQTMVHLGVDLGDIDTSSTLSSALKKAFRTMKLVVTSA